jgi:prepilin-type N-terminal cleavage/methylation domain-containing protein
MDKNSYGFTLVEIIVVIAILGIIAAIVVPRLTGFKSMAEEKVCTSNRKTVERSYNIFLLKNEHRESVFNRFLIEDFDEICSVSGVISYEDGKVKCSIHDDGRNYEEDDPPGDEVPWL